MKKLNSILGCMVIALAVFLSACTKQAETTSATSDIEEGVSEITLLNIKAEVTDQIKTLAQTYEAETGVHVEVLEVGPGVDAQAKKTRL